MTIESFFTTLTAPPSQGQPPGQPGGPLPAPSLQGLSFLEFILARINENSEQTTETAPKKNEEQPLQSDNPLLDKKPSLNLAEILAANPDIEQEVEDFIESTGLGTSEELLQVLSLNQQAFDDALKPLSDGIITTTNVEAGSPRLLQALLIDTPESKEAIIGQINALKAKIQAAVKETAPEAINLNLTPEQITIIQNINPKDVPEAFADELANLQAFIVKLTALESTKDTAIEISSDPAIQNVLAAAPVVANSNTPKNNAPQTNGIPANTPAADFGTLLPEQASERAQQQMQTLAAKLNALPVGAGEEPLFQIEEFEGSLQLSQNGAKNGKGPDITMPEATANRAPNANAAPAATLAMLQGLPFITDGIFAPAGFTQGAYDEYGLSTATTSLSASSAMNVITQAQSAAQPHPATQLVAASIQKAANSGENKTITLQLDPPELGRVQVQMSFGKEKALKAIVTAEKPETYLMLQRDAQTLERALSEIGLDADNGLSFELAEHGFDFDQDNRRGGGHDNGGTGAGDEQAEEELIETTMTWQIDPETGHTRYDILA